MLAAMEVMLYLTHHLLIDGNQKKLIEIFQGVNGNCKDLRIHMDALAEMVKMRGGLQGLGWSGVLHMFISWLVLSETKFWAIPTNQALIYFTGKISYPPQ